MFDFMTFVISISNISKRIFFIIEFLQHIQKKNIEIEIDCCAKKLHLKIINMLYDKHMSYLHETYVQSISF